MINRENVLAWFLAFVLLWFGVNEVMHPDMWARLVPAFLPAPSTMVLIHGIILLVAGLALLFNFYRKWVAIAVCVFLAEIVINFIVSDHTLSAVTVRDIGLFGMALALAL